MCILGYATFTVHTVSTELTNMSICRTTLLQEQEKKMKKKNI